MIHHHYFMVSDYARREFTLVGPVSDDAKDEWAIKLDAAMEGGADLDWHEVPEDYRQVFDSYLRRGFRYVIPSVIHGRFQGLTYAPPDYIH